MGYVWKSPNFSGGKSPYITSDYTHSTPWVHDPEGVEYGAGTIVF